MKLQDCSDKVLLACLRQQQNSVRRMSLDLRARLNNPQLWEDLKAGLAGVDKEVQKRGL